MSTPETHWIVELEEDPETGDLMMPLPPEMLKALGWKIGDDLTWKIDESGEIQEGRCLYAPPTPNPHQRTRGQVTERPHRLPRVRISSAWAELHQESP